MDIPVWDRKSLNIGSKCALVGKCNGVNGKTTLAKDLIDRSKQYACVVWDRCEQYTSEFDNVRIFNSNVEDLILGLDEGLILDSCSYPAKSILTRVMNTGKNVIYTAPYLVCIDKETRTKFDYWFVWKDKVVSNNARHYHSLFSNYFVSIKGFLDTIDCLDKYECLVLDKAQGRVFRYKCPMFPCTCPTFSF